MTGFVFLEYRGSGQYFPRNGAPTEIVPVKKVFYGPIEEFVMAKGNGYVINDKELKKIQLKWAQFCRTPL